MYSLKCKLEVVCFNCSSSGKRKFHNAQTKFSAMWCPGSVNCSSLNYSHFLFCSLVLSWIPNHGGKIGYYSWAFYNMLCRNLNTACATIEVAGCLASLNSWTTICTSIWLAWLVEWPITAKLEQLSRCLCVSVSDSIGKHLQLFTKITISTETGTKTN